MAQTVDFQVRFATGKGTKAAPYMFSEKLDKLFVQDEIEFPVGFRATTPCHELTNLQIRCKVIFKDFDSTAEMCANHQSQQRVPIGNYSGILQCTHNSTIYGRRNNVNSFVINVSDIQQSGSLDTVLKFKSTCLSTCNGVKRKPLQLLFALETRSGQELARRSVDFKISKCPGRDIVSGEKKDKEEGERRRNGKRKRQDSSDESNWEEDYSEPKKTRLDDESSDSNEATGDLGDKLEMFSVQVNRLLHQHFPQFTDCSFLLSFSNMAQQLVSIVNDSDC